MEKLTARQYFAKLKIGDIFFKNFANAVNSGNNTVSQNMIVESMQADDEWINQIEDLFYSVEKIVKDPKKSIMDEFLIVQIEKAKKITPDSIRHLSSHSNFIRSVDDDGTVNPAKIMTSYKDEDLAIYENRFIYTLITRLESFLEEKYRYLKQFSESFETVKLSYNSDFKYHNLDIDYDLKINVKKPYKGGAKQNNSVVLKKLEKLKKRVGILIGTDFCKKMSKVKPLKPPISKTNIIKMNTDYNNSYKLWLFLSSFINTGYSVNVSQLDLDINKEYMDDLSYLVAVSIKTMIENNIFAYQKKDEEDDEQKTKEFYIERDFNYIPVFNGFEQKDTNETDYLNQFYYEKIYEILTKEEKNQEIFKVKQDFAFPFTNFYKQLSNINNVLFKELINFDNNKKINKSLTKEEIKTEELKYQKELYRRNHLLTRLKNIDYQNSLKSEVFLLNKIKKLEHNLYVFKENEKEILKGESVVKNSSKKKLIKSNKDSSIKIVVKKGKTRKEITDEIKQNDEMMAKKILIQAEKEIKDK